MAEYINIKGTNVETVASDPANPTTGQIWYNSTSNTLKGLSVATSGTWASSGSMSLARSGFAAAGTQTAGLGFAGYAPSITNVSTATEEYDGSAWTAGGSLATARYVLGGAGIQTAALAVGGSLSPGDTSSTEEYDGSSWTAGGSLPSARRYAAGAGIQTAALAVGGISGGAYPGINNTEEYNGTSWTAGGGYPINVVGAGAAGTQTAAIASGGGNGLPSEFNSAYEYNGTSWSSTNNLNNIRYPNAMTGVQTAALAIAGATPSVLVESYDGTSFSADTNSPTALTEGDGTRSYTFASTTPGATFNYNGPGTPATVTITSS